MRNMKSGFSGSSALLLDTNVLYWLAVGDGRLSRAVADRLADADCAPAVSAVTAFEYADLVERGRLLGAPPLDDLSKDLHAAVLDLPADAWRLAVKLPPIHRDPIDRMLLAHALISDLPIATGDRHMRRYPVTIIW